MKNLTYSTILLLLASLIVACGSEGTSDNPGDADEEQAQVQAADEQQQLEQAEPQEQPEHRQETVADGGPEMKFEEDVHDFGTIPDDTKVSNRFEFTNTGDEPLVVQNVEAGCGCTAPSYSDEPIEPGEVGYVDVEYDSGFRDVPHFNQRVTIEANTQQGTHYVAVQGQIE